MRSIFKMRVLFTKKRLLILVVSLALFMCINANAATTLTVVVEDDCPYSCGSENELGLHGFVQDILKTIFSEYGVTVRFEIVPWLRALQYFNDRKEGVDAMIGMKVHPINKDISVFPEEKIATYIHCFYVRRDSPLVNTFTYKDIESLKDLHVGSVKGWNYCDKDITKYLAEGEKPYVQPIYGVGAETRNFKKLVMGRIQVWIANINNTEYLLARERARGNADADMITGLVDVPVTSEVSVYPVFYNTPQGKRYAELFTRGMRLLRTSGGLDKIMIKYGLSDWEK